MPDSLINYTANGWPYLDANNYVEVIPQYTDELANQLDLQVVNPDQRLTQAENDIDALETTTSGHGTRLTQAENDIDALETTTSGHGTRLTTAENDIDALETTTTGHATRLTTAENDIDALETHAALDIVGAGRPDIPATMTAAVAAAVAAAPSGATFRSTDGPQGAWTWQKQGASWIVVSGTTGWRDVTALFTLDAANTGKVLLRRNVASLEIRFDNVTVPAGTGIYLIGSISDPAWQPAYRTMFTIGRSSATNIRSYFTAGESANIYWQAERTLGTSADNTVRPLVPIRGGAQLPPLAAAWPTTLPGTAA